MATWNSVDVVTGAREVTKYSLYDTTELYIATMTTALANGDVVVGPVMPAGSYLTDFVLDVDQLDSNGSPTANFEVGYIQGGTTVAAGIIANGNTTARAGGVVIPNVNSTYGLTLANDATIIATITAGPATAKAGKMRFKLTYNPNA